MFVFLVICLSVSCKDFSRLFKLLSADFTRFSTNSFSKLTSLYLIDSTPVCGSLNDDVFKAFCKSELYAFNSVLASSKDFRAFKMSSVDAAGSFNLIDISSVACLIL